MVKAPAEVRKLIGLTGQYASVDEKLTGRQNLVMIGRLLGMRRAEARGRAAALLAEFVLEDAADRAAGSYSGGMRRRLDLAVSLVGRPSIVFMDEPTTGLDPRARADLWRIVREQVASGATVLLTTQYLEEADQLADEIVLIDHGVVAARGTPRELKARAGDRRLEIRPEHDAEKAELILAEVTGQTPHRGENGLLSVPLLDSAVSPAVFRRLEEAGVSSPSTPCAAHARRGVPRPHRHYDLGRDAMTAASATRVGPTDDKRRENAMTAVPSTTGHRGALAQGMTLAWRSLVPLRNEPGRLIQFLLQPVFMVVVFVLMFGAMSGDTEQAARFLLPGVLVQVALISTNATGMNLAEDIVNGVFDRFRSMPIARSAPLVGRVTADALTTAVTIAVALLAGIAAGFRITASPWARWPAWPSCCCSRWR
ncbi:hypothetical protein GCM10027612_30930 [Microbispora bryophytorum subsp. camponoti]